MSGLHTLLKSARADIACSKKPHSKQMILKGANMMNKLISYFGTFTPGADGAVGAFQFEYLTGLGFAALVIFADVPLCADPMYFANLRFQRR